MSSLRDEDDGGFLRRLTNVRETVRRRAPAHSSPAQRLREGASTELVSDDDDDPPPRRNRSIVGHNPHPLSRHETFLPPSDPYYWAHDVGTPRGDTFARPYSDLDDLPSWPDDLSSTQEVLRETFPDSDDFLLDDWLISEVMNSADLVPPPKYARRKPGPKPGALTVILKHTLQTNVFEKQVQRRLRPTRILRRYSRAQSQVR